LEFEDTVLRRAGTEASDYKKIKKERSSKSAVLSRLVTIKMWFGCHESS
jgi:hypothetical protein